MKRLAIVLVLSACTPAQPPVAAVEVVPPVAADAGATKRDDVTPPARACDNDGTEPATCAGLHLGQCVAAEYYACPREAKLPAGTGFRAKMAKRIGACLAKLEGGSASDCVPGVETCVRDAVAEACVEDEATSICERELGTCSAALRGRCAKLLSSLEPTTRESALNDLRQQREMTGSATTCRFSRDLNGFPFCPYCPFR